MTFSFLHRNIRVIGIFALGITFVSCTDNINQVSGLDYQMDNTISKINGDLIDSSRYFLPLLSVIDTSKDQNSYIYNSRFSSISRFYEYFKAPILYNYYSGFETYRFLWVRSFHYPVMITIVKKNKPIINTKVLISKRHPDIRVYLPENLSHTQGSGIGIWDLRVNEIRKRFPTADSIVLPKYTIRDTSYNLKKEQWDTFKTLLIKSNFWSLYPLPNPRPMADGADWILEGHTKDKYYFIMRQSPQDSFKDCCEYLIKISAAKSEEIY